MTLTDLVITALVSGIAAYLGSYLKKKGENLATHEDIQRLVAQVRETENVRAEISDRMWDRQRRWETKKDLYLEAYSSLHKLYDRLIEVAEAQQVMALKSEDFDQDRLVEAINQLRSEFDKFGRVSFTAPLFFSDATTISISQITKQAASWMTIVTGNELPELLQKGDFATVRKNFDRGFQDAITQFAAAARMDLGYPPAGHSNFPFGAS